MTIKDFESKIQREIHQDLKIIPHPINLDMAGVYFRGAYLCGVPSNNIYEKRNPSYTNQYGEAHVPYPEVEGRVRNYLAEMKKDPELLDFMAKPADQL